MRTDKQIEASRRNGARSRGPITPEGKRRSSCNSTRHGMFANSLVIDGESRDGFNATLDEYIRKFQPLDDVEHDLVEEMVAARWRLFRLWHIEARLFEEALSNIPRDAEGSPLADAFSDLSGGPRLQLIDRYENRLHRIYHRCVATFTKLRAFKQRDHTPQDWIGSAPQRDSAPETAAPAATQNGGTNPTNTSSVPDLTATDPAQRPRDIAYLTYDDGVPVMHLPDICIVDPMPPTVYLEPDPDETNPAHPPNKPMAF